MRGTAHIIAYSNDHKWPPAHLSPDEEGEVSPECGLLPHPPPLAAHQHHTLQVAVAQVAQDLRLQLLGQRQDVAAPAPASSMHSRPVKQCMIDEASTYTQKWLLWLSFYKIIQQLSLFTYCLRSIPIYFNVVRQLVS